MTVRVAMVCCLVGCASGSATETDAAATPAIDAPRATDAPSMHADSTVGACAFTGVLATWNFAGELGNQLATTVDTTAPGVGAGSITRSAGLTAVSGASSINSSNWPLTATRDLTKYYSLTLTPPAGCALSITMIAIDAKASSTGPITAQLSSSLDMYGATQTVSTAAPSNLAMSVQANAMVELRVYGFSASGTAGTLRLQNALSITGSVD